MVVFWFVGGLGLCVVIFLYVVCVGGCFFS